MKKNIFNLMLGVASVVILAALPVLAQGRGAARGLGMLAQPAGRANPLARLERALAAASAPAINAEEQSAIMDLIKSFIPTPPRSSSAVQGFEAAILAGKTDHGAAQAITDVMATNFENRAGFASNLANVLISNGQMTPLVTKFGTSRVVQLLESFVGGGLGAGQGRRIGMLPPAAR